MGGVGEGCGLPRPAWTVQLVTSTSGSCRALIMSSPFPVSTGVMPLSTNTTPFLGSPPLPGVREKLMVWEVLLLWEGMEHIAPRHTVHEPLFCIYPRKVYYRWLPFNQSLIYPASVKRTWLPPTAAAAAAEPLSPPHFRCRQEVSSTVKTFLMIFLLHHFPFCLHQSCHKTHTLQQLARGKWKMNKNQQKCPRSYNRQSCLCLYQLQSFQSHYLRRQVWLWHSKSGHTGK